MAAVGTQEALALEGEVEETGLEASRPFIRLLCDYCSQEFQQSRTVSQGMNEVESNKSSWREHRYDLIRLADRGHVTCPICATMYRLNERHEKGSYASSPARARSCTVSAPTTVIYWPEDKFQLHILPLVDQNLESIRMAKSYSYPQNTGDEAIINLIQVWMNRCSENHKCYQRWETYYPPRLLDLRTDRVHLRTAEELKGSNKQDDAYATLSHCWGGATNFMKLSTTNIEEFRSKGISLDDLPKTFREAITLCRKLNIQLLWIDSLCILQSGQGSDEDWLRHLTEMRMIYYRCTINLAADHSPNPHGGLFVDRASEQVKPTAIVRVVKSEAGEDSLEPHLIVHADIDGHVYGESRLSQRGWVFQERLLSSRVIHFSHDRVFWECAESCQVSETYPAGITPLEGPMTGYPRAFERPSSKKRMGWTPDLEEAFYQFVEEFSRRQLTYPDTDKLPAFSGVAEHFYRTVKRTQYIAGLFREHLPEALLWVPAIQPPPSGPPRSISDQYRCPSWSWAKLDSKVEMFRGQSPPAQALVQITDISVDLLDSEYRYGRLKNATLTMTGRLIEMRWKRYDENNEKFEWEKWWERLEYPQPYRNERTADPLLHGGEPTTCYPANFYVTAICFDSVRDSYVDQRDVWFMPIVQADPTESPIMALVLYNGVEGVAGLILQNIRSDGPDCYRRIGTARFVGKNVKDYILELPEQHIVLK